MSNIHATAIIEPGAEIGPGCEIGPYCCIGAHVKMGARNILHSNVIIDGHTTLGHDNEIYPFAVLGKISQDLKFDKSWITYSVIGSHNVIREYVTVNAASIEGETTRIGDHCLLLSYSHIAHDCVLGDHVIVSCDSKLAGHVTLEDHAILNAKSGVVQFVRIGKHAFVGGFNKVAKDILPFCIADGSPSVIRAVNKIGLERNGFTGEQIAAVTDAYKVIIRSGKTVQEAIALLEERYPGVAEVSEMTDFLQSSKIGLARPRKHAS